MPGYACPIKERMLYSSSKNPVIELLENGLNLVIAKKVHYSAIIIIISLSLRHVTLNICHCIPACYKTWLKWMRGRTINYRDGEFGLSTNKGRSRKNLFFLLLSRILPHVLDRVRRTRTYYIHARKMSSILCLVTFNN